MSVSFPTDAEPSAALKASPRVRESAEKLERHIRACGLKPGDRYITTEEAGKLLGTSLVVAQRAMALLAERKILERRPKAGTFIGEAIGADVQTAHLHFFVPEQTRAEGGAQAGYWEQIDGMKSALGPLSAHFHFVPNQNLGYVQQIVRQTSAAGMLNGAILVLASREIRAFFNQSGIPTVVEGGVEADLTNLCWMQWDQMETGRLLTAYLLERGHRRIATVMRDIWGIGEHLLHDGIAEALTAAALPSNTLRMRSAPSERQAIVELAHGLFREENPPTGFICRNEFQADCVAEAARAAGRSAQVDITHCNPPSRPDPRRYTCAVPDLSAFEFGKVAGEMFRQVMANQIPERRGLQIPVRLEIPAAS
jgi:DNA-binding LacI/PurR family transcriptional regulator